MAHSVIATWRAAGNGVQGIPMLGWSQVLICGAAHTFLDPLEAMVPLDVYVSSVTVCTEKFPVLRVAVLECIFELECDCWW